MENGHRNRHALREIYYVCITLTTAIGVTVTLTAVILGILTLLLLLPLLLECVLLSKKREKNHFFLSHSECVWAAWPKTFPMLRMLNVEAIVVTNDGCYHRLM